MEIECPKCGQRVAAEDVNVAKDLALCRRCNEAFAVSDALGASELADVDFSNPPRGVEISDLGNRLTLTSTARSSMAWFFVIFAVFWNSIVSVFLSIAIAGAVTGEEVMDGPFPGFLFVFLIPFVLVGVGMAGAALFTLVGKVRVTLDRDVLTVFTGVGSIGRVKTIDWREVTAVRIVDSGARSNNQPMMAVEVDGPSPIRFGTLLSEERRNFLAAVLRRLQLERR